LDRGRHVPNRLRNPSSKFRPRADFSCVLPASSTDNRVVFPVTRYLPNVKSVYPVRLIFRSNLRNAEPRQCDHTTCRTDPCDASLLLHQRYRRDVSLASTQHVIDASQYASTREDNDSPIEVHEPRCVADTGCQREEREDKANNQECKGDIVDHSTPLAQ
jgi:hypothetical protein